MIDSSSEESPDGLPAAAVHHPPRLAARKTRWNPPYNPSSYAGSCHPPPLEGIHVLNFPKGIKESEIVTFFSKFGKVVSICPRSYCWNTRCSERFVTVAFEDEAVARAIASSKSDVEMDGYILRIIKPDFCYGPDIETEIEDGCYSHVNRAGTLEEYQIVDDHYLTGEGKCNINSLNDDCLLEIFSYVGMMEKIKLELVCKRWRAILLDHWKTVTHLDFEKNCSIEKLNNCMLHKILQRCGMHLQSLDMPSESCSRNGWDMQIISSLCPSLTHLQPSVEVTRISDAHRLILNCKNLKSLHFKSSWNMADDVLELFFENLQLESFSIPVLSSSSRRFLTKLPQTIKYLTLQVSVDQIHNLCKGLHQLKSLKSLKLDQCHPTAYTCLKSLPSKQSIEELSLSNHQTPYNVPKDIHLDYLSEFYNLKKLHLRCNRYVNDKLLTLISQSCKNLELLDISECNGYGGYSQIPLMPGVTDVGIITIAQKSSVTRLYISQLYKITDKSLVALAKVGKVRGLICQNCSNISQAVLSRLISSCLNLELLDVRNNENVTDEIIHMAEKIVILKPNRKLHLILTENQTMGKDIPVTSKFLKVEITRY